MTTLAPSPNGVAPHGALKICKCTHAKIRHQHHDGEDLEGTCGAEGCNCFEFDPMPVVDNSPLSAEAVLAKAKASRSKRVSNAARRIEAQLQALVAVLKAEAGREVIRADIEALEARLATAKAQLRGPVKPKAKVPGPAKGAGEYPCPDCDKVAKSAGGLGSHRQAKHGTPGTAAGR